MPPKPTKTFHRGPTHTEMNRIYELALNTPLEGYDLSPLFREANSVCPHCGEKLWTRIRFGTIAILGVVCAACSWRHTFAQTVDTPPSPQQIPLFDAQKNSAPSNYGL